MTGRVAEGGAHPAVGQQRQRLEHEVAVDDGAAGVRREPGVDVLAGEPAGERVRPAGAGVEVEQGGHGVLRRGALPTELAGATIRADAVPAVDYALRSALGTWR